MDTNVWKDFFDMLLTTPMTNDAVKVYIEDRNLPVWDKTEIINNISALGIDTTAKMSEYLLFFEKSTSRVSSENASAHNLNTDAPVVDTENVPSRSEIKDMKEKWGLFAMFAEFFETIIAALKWLANTIPDEGEGPGTSTDRAVADTEVAPEEVVQTIEQQARTLFREKLIVWSTKVDAFVQIWGSRMITEWKSTHENLASTLQSYIEYRTNWDRIPYQEWFDTVDGIESDTDSIDSSASK